MKFDFTDSNHTRYECELNVEPSIIEPHIEVTVCRSLTNKSTTIRLIVNDKVKWHNLDDWSYFSLEARVYLDKVIKNRAFL